MSSQKNAAPLYALSQAETNDPLKVIDELFDFADLTDVKDLLWSWLKVTVTGTYHKDLSSTERSAILTLYEKVERLVDAAHIIHTEKKAHKGTKARGKER